MTEQEFYRAMADELIPKLRTALHEQPEILRCVAHYELDYYNDSEYAYRSTIITLRRIRLRPANGANVPDFDLHLLKEFLTEHGLVIGNVYYNHHGLNVYFDFSARAERLRQALPEPLIPGTLKKKFRVGIRRMNRRSEWTGKLEYVPVEAGSATTAEEIANRQLFGSRWHIVSVDECDETEYNRLIANIMQAEKRAGKQN